MEAVEVRLAFVNAQLLLLIYMCINCLLFLNTMILKNKDVDKPNISGIWSVQK
jgi:hypothetical protein